MMNDSPLVNKLLDFIHYGSSPFHAVLETSKILEANGFKPLSLTAKWKLSKGDKYYVTRNGSSLFAFIIGSGDPVENGLRIIATHSDSPTFKIKPDPCIHSGDSYIRVNTEVYGSPILMTWLDRPLSISGRVTTKSSNPLWPNNLLVNFNRPIAIIPSLAIHLNRSVNDGFELKKQTHMLPLVGIGTNLEKSGVFRQLLAQELDINPLSILDFDLVLHEYQKGCVLGINNEFISSSRIDNLAMVHAGIEGLISASEPCATAMLCLFDNEEVGSLTKQGAGAPLFGNIVKRVLEQLGQSTEDVYRTIYNSFMVSADMAHALHPGYPEKYDPVNQPIINNGPVIKIAANQKYTSDSDSIAVFESVCQQSSIPYQKFVNHSDVPGGSTLGNVLTGHLDLRSVDVGNAMLAMHSARELAGTLDHSYISKSFATFFAI